MSLSRVQRQNRERAQAILRALGTNPDRYEMADLSAAITDALTDLRHLCDWKRVDFDACDRSAYGHYAAELNGELP